MTLSIFRQTLIERLFEKEGGRCRYCRRAVRKRFFTHEDRPDDATVDHIIPRAKQGTNDPDNLALACRKCNHAKGDRELLDFLADPRPASERKAAAKAASSKAATQKKRRRALRAAGFPAGPSTLPTKSKMPPSGTLAYAIMLGEVTDHGTYKRVRPRDIEPKNRIPQPQMSALETARWLREQHEKRGKPWPLA